MTIQYRCYMILHNERNGSCTLRARVKMVGMRTIDFAIGRSIPSKTMWDAARQRVTPKAPDAREVNLFISDIIAEVNSFFARMSLVEERAPTREEVLSALKGATGRANACPTGRLPMLDAFDAYTAYMGREWADGTYRKYRALRSHLSGYDGRAYLSEVDGHWLAGFTEYLSQTCGVNNNTVMKYVKAMRAFLRWSEKENGTGHVEYRPRLKGAGQDKEVVYLTLDELREVETHELEGTMAQVRDVFVFCCYTGLRFSDAKRLRHDDVHDGYIEVVTQKTDERIRIELNSHSRAILERYGRLPEYALPAISNQKSNRYLKAIGRLCSITTPVRKVWYVGAERREEVVEKCMMMTTHTARRTFVVTALQLGIPVEVIIRWTGHSDYKSMRPYVAIVDELKRRNMDKFDTI